MNGWLRLWVLVSLVWAVVVVSATAIVIPDKLGGFDPSTARFIESGSKYSGNPFDQFDSVETVESADSAGHNVEVMPSNTDTEQKSMDEVFATLFKEGEKIEQPTKPLPKKAIEKKEDETETFIQNAWDSLVELKQKEARQRSWLAAEENRKARQGVIRTSIMASTIPPLVILLLGYGIAWVRRGFRS